MSKFKSMHSLSELKSIFAIEQKVIVSCFVKDVALLLGHPVQNCQVCSSLDHYSQSTRDFVNQTLTEHALCS